MALHDLTEVIEKLQSIINAHHEYLSGKERRTRQVLIDPLLKAFGWDVSDPRTVYLEYKKMDYALMMDDNPVAVIEAKPLGNALESNVRIQAIAYAVENNISHIIVTNGDRWEMYDVLKPGTLLEKKIMEFQLAEDKSHDCMLQALRIWKPNLGTGHPNEAMQPVLAPPSAGEINDTPPEPPVNDSPHVDVDDMPIVYENSSSTRALYQKYWTALKSSVEQHGSSIKFRKPQPRCLMGFAVGRSGFEIQTWASKMERYICVGLDVRGPNGKTHFQRLLHSKIEIESQIGAKLEWQENRAHNFIRLYRQDTNLEDTQDWHQQHQWLYEQLEIFHRVFGPRIQAI